MGTTFRRSQISTFPEFVYFTGVKTLTNLAFGSSTISSINLSNLTSISYQAFRESSIIYPWLPNAKSVGSVSAAANYSVFLNCRSIIALRLDSATSVEAISYGSTLKYMVVTTSNVPTARGGQIPLKIYVLDSLVGSYQAATNWKSKTILPISQLATDYPACPWLDDLRTKGFIS